LVNVTVVPVATLRFGGTNLKFVILTAVPGTGISGSVAGRSLKQPSRAAAPATRSTRSRIPREVLSQDLDRLVTAWKVLQFQGCAIKEFMYE
jgi:hypothetical protein